MQSRWIRSFTLFLGMQGLSLGLTAQTATPRVVLVELFTSEGCSSCPPADALLRAIDGTRSASGQLIVGISEHVTYWNSLGWADPFSSMLFTDRQKSYGDRFGLDSVYTPQMVVNGTEQLVGNDRDELSRAFKKELDRPAPIELHILSAKIVGESVVIRFSTASTVPKLKADIVAVFADDADRPACCVARTPDEA